MDGSSADFAALIDEIRLASVRIERADEANNRQIAELHKSINDIYRRISRPGNDNFPRGDNDNARADARRLCIEKRLDTSPRDAGPYEPSHGEIEQALNYCTALTPLMRAGDATRLSPENQKSLTSFNFGNNAFVLAPEMSDRVLSCLVDLGDLTGLVDSQNISGPSIKFLVDNVRLGDAGWACKASCWANNPQPDLSGLGEIEIKAESIRSLQCISNDLLLDASFNIEQFILRKVSDSFRYTINRAIIAGTGMGMPAGLLAVNSGVPVCEVSPSTPAGQFTWQDLVMLKYQVPIQWHPNAVFVMSQQTYAQLITMVDATSRPIMVADPTYPAAN